MIMKEVWSKCNQVHMEIWNSKFERNMYFEFEVKFRVLFNVIFLEFYISFWSLRIHESKTSNGVQIEVEMRKLWALEIN